MCQPCQPCGQPVHRCGYRTDSVDCIRGADAMLDSSSRERSEGDEDDDVSVANTEEESEAESDLENRTTNRAVKQFRESFDRDIYDPKKARDGQRPMVEKTAGKNIWLQGSVLQESLNEIQLDVKGVHADPEKCIIWLNKKSSRIWRGSLRGKDWKHLKNGEWKPVDSRARKGSSKLKKRKGASGGASEGEATGVSVGPESGSDEDMVPQRKRPKRHRTGSRDLRQTPVPQQFLAHASGEEQHSTSEVVDIPGVSTDRPGDTSRADHWVFSRH
eukprot:jgi/Botrbrau1/12626/Bobra.0169s0151.3